MCGCERHRDYVCDYHRSPAAHRNAMRVALRSALRANLARYATARDITIPEPAHQH